jgi:hypothetical protein
MRFIGSEPESPNDWLADCTSKYAKDCSISTSSYISQEQFHGFPESVPGVEGKEGWIPGKNTILTNTPEKNS